MKGDYTNKKKKRMRHTYEIHAILSAIYCINETTVKDDVAKLIEYALFRVYKDSPVQMREYCNGKEKSDVIPNLIDLLISETYYIK